MVADSKHGLNGRTAHSPAHRIVIPSAFWFVVYCLPMDNAIITVVGKDTVGILAKTCTCLAENNVNILDISQTAKTTST